MTCLHDIDIVKTVLMILILLILKSLTSMLTILPDPSGMCHEKHGGNEILKCMFGTCNDLMFSGHAGTVILLTMILRPHIKFVNFFLLSCFVIILCLITSITCNHYTIDVVMSYFVAYFVYNTFK